MDDVVTAALLPRDHRAVGADLPAFDEVADHPADLPPPA
jgi:hypothetical protein